MSILETIRNDIGLSQSIECLEKGLVYLFLNKTISTKELAKKMEIPVTIATAFKKELVKHGLMKRESFYFMTPLGKKYVTQHLNYKGIDIELYERILTSDEAMNRFLLGISQPLQAYYINRPLAKVELDQAHATSETLIKRISLFLKDPLIFSKTVAFVGDDDLTSIFLANKTPQVQRYLQNRINELGYNFLEIKPNFNKYIGGSVIGNVSNLYILQNVSISNSSISTKDSIYTQDSKKRKQIQRLGFHRLYELRDCNENLLSTVESVKEVMYAIVDKFKLNVVTDNFHQFTPHGVSGMIILQESHFTIHTWPEYNYAALDLFVCKDTINEKQVMEMLQRLFHSKRYEYTKLYRES